ncbi:MAG TPA: hypothetical protein VF607_13045, partial [Verrucomicrobiae bacterium]
MDLKAIRWFIPTKTFCSTAIFPADTAVSRTQNWQPLADRQVPLPIFIFIASSRQFAKLGSENYRANQPIPESESLNYEADRFGKLSDQQLGCPSLGGSPD